MNDLPRPDNPLYRIVYRIDFTLHERFPRRYEFPVICNLERTLWWMWADRNV